MVTFLSGGTGTPKLLGGAVDIYDPDSICVICNTGDDIELGGLFISPDVDTVLYERSGMLDRDRWWGISGDTTQTHEHLQRLGEVVDGSGPAAYLPDERQTAGRDLADWRRFSALGEFMEIGDHDRAVHLARTSLLDHGYSLTAVTRALADGFEIRVDVLPMSDDPVASRIETPDGWLHFQEYWVGRGGNPPVTDVEYRGSEHAIPADPVMRALSDPVIIGPANPITSIGPMVAMPEFESALTDTTVVAVSPFVGNRVFSGPAAELMRGVGIEASTAGVADLYPFADAFVLDSADETDLDRPVIHTDTEMNTKTDARRVARATRRALEAVS